MDIDWDRTYRAARRRYEIGRTRTALLRAAAVTSLAAIISSITLGRAALAWLPLTFGVCALTEWQGRFWMKGARRGVLAGFVSLVLPLSILRPCCASDPAAALSASCCTMPSICWVTGGALGLALSLLMPKDIGARRWDGALGMLLGVTSVTVVRCAALFVAEAVGLLGGLLAGVVAASLARAWIDRMKAAV